MLSTVSFVCRPLPDLTTRERLFIVWQNNGIRFTYEGKNVFVPFSNIVSIEES